MKNVEKNSVSKIVGQICDKCGSEIPYEDGFSLDYTFGYFSKRDGDSISLDICNDCLESILGKELIEKGLKESSRLSQLGIEK